MTFTFEEVKNYRDEHHCSMQHAKHKVIQKKLIDVLKNPCTVGDMQVVLMEVVTNGGLIFK